MAEKRGSGAYHPATCFPSSSCLSSHPPAHSHYLFEFLFAITFRVQLVSHNADKSECLRPEIVVPPKARQLEGI